MNTRHNTYVLSFLLGDPVCAVGSHLDRRQRLLVVDATLCQDGRVLRVLQHGVGEGGAQCGGALGRDGLARLEAVGVLLGEGGVVVLQEQLTRAHRPVVLCLKHTLHTVERSGSGVELRLSTTSTRVGILYCSVKTLGKFFHSTLLQFTQLYK